MNYPSHNDTIIAQCTPSGSGALALLRISGTGAFSISDTISSIGALKKISTVPSHTIHYGKVVDGINSTIDHVLFLVMKGPHTFTGEDTVEITCHNNPFIISTIINAAISAGARIAQQGEFSRRAVENNKIDITQAEAINDLIHANTQHALKKSLSQLEGSFSHWISSIEKQLIKALALSEASFEFIDEENMEFNTEIKDNIVAILAQSESLKKTFSQQQQIRQGIRIAIIGSVNAGKSSFFNSLLNQNRAIVSEIAGTTRDVIEAGIYKDDSYWTVIDTAGLRTTNDIIEQMGIIRSREEAAKADIILLVFDGSRPLSSDEQELYNELMTTYQKKIVLIHNKSDLPSRHNFTISQKPIFEFSSTTKNNVGAIETAIQEKITELFTTIESPFLLNQRHYNTLLSLENSLHAIIPMLINNTSYELVSYHLQHSLATLSELTGKTISEAGMDAVFREFCIGK